MKFLANLHEARLNLISSKLRSMLALLGILVGTASVVAMVSGGELATNEALRTFKNLGTDLLAVTLNDKPTDEENKTLQPSSITVDQALNLSKIDKQIQQVAPYTLLYSTSQFENEILDSSILGVTNNFAHIAHINIAQGRFVSLFDNFSSFCVIGSTLAKKIRQSSGLNPLNQQIQIGSTYFTVIGIAAEWPENSFVYADINNSILIPLMSSFAINKYSTISSLLIRLQQNANIEKVNENITNYFEEIAPTKLLYIRSAKELIASMTQQSKILTVFLGLIGSISLLVGGIGVMNIMLVSVVERKKEIGIRLAVGARRKDIRHLFLIEAVLLSLVGGISGVLLGSIIAYIIALVWKWHFIFLVWPAIIGFTVSVAIGIFFGFYPAYQASRLDPIEALRTE